MREADWIDASLSWFASPFSYTPSLCIHSVEHHSVEHRDKVEVNLAARSRALTDVSAGSSLASIRTIRSSCPVSLLSSPSPPSRPERPSRVLLLPYIVGALTLLAVIASGCGSGRGTPPDVDTGRFEAELDGAFDRSVTGEARYRMTEGNLTGLELVIDSARGISVELEPGPIRRKTYQVVEWELLSVDRPGGRPGTFAFLETPDGSFESVEGMLDITYHEDNAIGGTFEFEMNGTLKGLPGEPYGLSARGRWIATPLLVD